MKSRHAYVLLLLALVLIPGCYVGRAIFWNFADIRDAKKFQSRPVENGGTPFHFKEAATPIEPKIPAAYQKPGHDGLDAFMHDSKSLALLIIRNDTLLFERYDEPLDSATLHPSFSASKSYVSALVGIAIAEGKIGGVTDPIVKYLPELKNAGMEKITIDHLLQMRTGLKYNEGYFNPFGNVAKYYYGRNILKFIPRLRPQEDPDQSFEYVSVATQLLGIIVERATGMKLEKHLQEKIWIPLGMESEATWSIDSKKYGMIKAFCCLNATARDYAKFGRLYLNKGNWNGQQIVPEAWVERSITPYTPGQKFYSTQWWLLKEHRFAAIGFLGQYIVVDPVKKMVIVRLGKKNGDVNWTGLLDEILSQY